MAEKINFHKKSNPVSAPTSADDGVYFIKPDTSTTFNVEIIDKGVKYSMNPGRTSFIPLTGTEEGTVINGVYNTNKFHLENLTNNVKTIQKLTPGEVLYSIGDNETYQHQGTLNHEGLLYSSANTTGSTILGINAGTYTFDTEINTDNGTIRYEKYVNKYGEAKGINFENGNRGTQVIRSDIYGIEYRTKTPISSSFEDISGILTDGRKTEIKTSIIYDKSGASNDYIFKVGENGIEATHNNDEPFIAKEDADIITKKYLENNLNLDYVPLTGTKEGKPITGTIEVDLPEIMQPLFKRSVVRGNLSTEDSFIFDNHLYYISEKSVAGQGYSLSGFAVIGQNDPGKPDDMYTQIGHSKWHSTDDSQKYNAIIGMYRGLGEADFSSGFTSKYNMDALRPTDDNMFVQRSYVKKEILKAVPRPPATGTHILKSVNGVVAWVAE